mgnify:CR=1 FL=1
MRWRSGNTTLGEGSMRTIDTEQFESLSRKRPGPWRMEDGRMLRIACGGHPIPTEDEAREMLATYQACAASVGTPNAYEIVRVPGGYGVVVDYVVGLAMGVHISIGSYTPAELGHDMAELLRRLHATHMEAGLDWNDTKIMQMTHRERVSTKQSITDTLFRRELTGRAFMGDPDVFFLREANCKLTPEEKEKLYTVNALLGGMLLTSDALNAYTDAQKAKFREVRRLMEEATDVAVEADNGVSVRYKLDGKEKTLRIL